MNTPYTLPLDSPAADLATVGGKGASLCRLAQADLPVPPGFHITTAAYQRFVAANDLQAQLLALAATAQADDPASLDAASAAILFTANPLTGYRGQAVIDAAWGLGEAVVGGLVTPDNWVVDKASGQVVARDIRDKAVMTVRTATGTEEVPVPIEQRGQSVLSEAQAVALARLAARIESLYGMPQDIEWALADGEVYILQSRPITSLFPQPSPLPPDGAFRVYLNLNYLQGLVEPVTPAGMSSFRDTAREIQHASHAQLVSETGPSVFNSVAGHVFVDVTTPLRSPRARRILRGVLPLLDPQMQAAVEGLLADPRLAPTTDAPLPLTAWRRFRFVLPVPKAVLPRVLRLWRDPDGARRAFLAEVNGEIAALHDQIAAAQTLAERVSPLELMPSFQARVGPRLLAMGMSGTQPQYLAQDLVKRWLGDETAVLDLLRGIPHNPTTQMDLTLWALSRAVAADPASAEAFREPTETVVARYRARTLPPTAQAALGTFLGVYGHRAVREIDLGAPRWSDEPGYIVDTIRTYLDMHDPALAPDVRFHEGAVAAQARAEALLDQVAATPGGRLRRPLLAAILGRMRAAGATRGRQVLHHSHDGGDAGAVARYRAGPGRAGIVGRCGRRLLPGRGRAARRRPGPPGPARRAGRAAQGRVPGRNAPPPGAAAHYQRGRRGLWRRLGAWNRYPPGDGGLAGCRHGRGTRHPRPARCAAGAG
ncbi:MAG: PEP/pyruvate-binding domain-containing protein [Anaerolineae bacterium]